LNMNPECRLVAKSFFLLTKDTPLCYSGTNSSVIGRFAR
jgi:hypothetical protein